MKRAKGSGRNLQVGKGAISRVLTLMLPLTMQSRRVQRDYAFVSEERDLYVV